MLMKSSQESGVLNFIAGFVELVTNVLALATSFNPKLERIKTPNLQASLTQMNTLQAEAVALDGQFRNAIASRKAIYAPIPKLVTRVTNAFLLTDADPNLKANFKAVAAKFRSSSKPATASATASKAKATDGAATSELPKKRSTAQTGYDSIPGHLNRMISYIETVHSYDPAEVDITLSALKDLSARCTQSNLVVMEVASKYNMARDRRDDFLYNKSTGLNVVAQEVKKYVKSAYGADSDIFKRINAIRLK